MRSGLTFNLLLFKILFSKNIEKHFIFFVNLRSRSVSPIYQIFLFGFFDIFFNANKKGYFEDRRPSSNCDPYLVTGKIFETTCL